MTTGELGRKHVQRYCRNFVCRWPSIVKCRVICGHNDGKPWIPYMAPVFQGLTIMTWAHAMDAGGTDGTNDTIGFVVPGAVPLRSMTSQFQDIVNHKQKWMSVKCIFCDIWIQNFVWHFTKVPFEISLKILNTYSAKYAFYEVLKIWRIMIS